MSISNIGRIVSFDWQSSAEGETILQHFYDPQTTGRKITGKVCYHPRNIFGNIIIIILSKYYINL